MNMQGETNHTLYWIQLAAPFYPGETIAAAFLRGGVAQLGESVGGLRLEPTVGRAARLGRRNVCKGIRQPLYQLAVPSAVVLGHHQRVATC